nr:DUF927 domain-containing protein [uncultured Niameybacter sp.]
MNFDTYINYEIFYLRYIDGAKIKGRQLKGCCPFHADTHPSLEANLDTGQYYCHGCGAKGNVFTFVKEKEGLHSNQEIIQFIENITGNSITHTASQPVSSLAAYARLKNLPKDFLETLKVYEHKNNLHIPYCDIDGIPIRNRIRPMHGGKPYWDNQVDKPIVPYGLWMLEKYTSDYIILVEGESDTQTLLLNGFQVLGIPGASTFKLDWIKYIEKFKKIYLFIEPEDSGKIFFSNTLEKFSIAKLSCKIFTFSFDKYKDPSEAWCDMKSIDKFTSFIKTHMSNACWIDLKTKQEKKINFSPLFLKGLEHYDVTPKGVFQISKNEDGSDKYIPIISTPLVISARVKLFNNSQEQIQISYYKDKQWHQTTCMRSEIFNTRTLVKLADLGINVSSNNAKALLYYLEALQDANYNVFPILQTVKTLGWHDDNFIPYGNSTITLADDEELQDIYSGFVTKGNLQENLEYMYSIINSHPIVRLYVMTSCASPMLKDLGQRIICLYIWGPSGSGKTAALQLALSVWGNPSKLMRNFNATSCGLEELCNILKVLPLGLNERQQRIVDKSTQLLLESLVYMLAEGIGRSKSSKSGGVKAITSWNTPILANGEMPLLQDHSNNGARNRCLEICAVPFKDTAIARDIYTKVSFMHGILGEAIVNKLLITPNYNQVISNIKALIKDAEILFMSEFPSKNPTHINLIATIFAIDHELTNTVFKFTNNTLTDVCDIADIYRNILNSLPDLVESDLIERFYESTKDWLSINHHHFATSSTTPTTSLNGVCESTATHINYYVYQDIFRVFCESNNISYKQALEGFATKGYIQTEKPNGKGRRTVRKTLNGRQQQFILFSLSL